VISKKENIIYNLIKVGIGIIVFSVGVIEYNTEATYIFRSFERIEDTKAQIYAIPLILLGAFLIITSFVKLLKYALIYNTQQKETISNLSIYVNEIKKEATKVKDDMKQYGDLTHQLNETKRLLKDIKDILKSIFK